MRRLALVVLVGGALVLLAYVAYASTILDITWARFLIGLDHGRRFLSRMFPPDLAPDKMELLYSGMMESLQIAILATVFGTLISLPPEVHSEKRNWPSVVLLNPIRQLLPLSVAVSYLPMNGTT